MLKSIIKNQKISDQIQKPHFMFKIDLLVNIYMGYKLRNQS
jgi:hypothetical protein